MPLYSFTNAMTEQDYIAFNTRHHLTSPAAKKNVLFHRLFDSLAVLFLGAVLSNTMARSSHYSSNIHWIILVVFVIGAVAVYFIVPKTIGLNTKLLLRGYQKSGKLFDASPARIDFYDTFLTESSAGAETKMDYGKLVRVDDAPAGVYLFYTATQAFVLPNRVFQSPEQRAAFLAFVRAKQEQQAPH